MKRTMITSAIIFLAGFVAFGAQHQPPANAPGMSMMQDCPMKVQGAELSVADTKGGIALTFTTNSDVSELRLRAEKMAKMHGSSADAPMKHEGMMKHEAMIPFTAQYEEVPNGARLALTPKDPERLEEFRTKVRQHAEQMKKGECSMMQGPLGGMMQSRESQLNPPKVEPKQDDVDHESHHPKE